MSVMVVYPNLHAANLLMLTFCGRESLLRHAQSGRRQSTTSSYLGSEIEPIFVVAICHTPLQHT